MRAAKAASFGTKMLTPCSVLLAWFCKVWSCLVLWSKPRKVWKGPATVSKLVMLQNPGEGAGAGAVVGLIGAGGDWEYADGEKIRANVEVTMNITVKSTIFSVLWFSLKPRVLNFL